MQKGEKAENEIINDKKLRRAITVSVGHGHGGIAGDLTLKCVRAGGEQGIPKAEARAGTSDHSEGQAQGMAG